MIPFHLARGPLAIKKPNIPLVTVEWVSFPPEHPRIPVSSRMTSLWFRSSVPDSSVLSIPGFIVATDSDPQYGKYKGKQRETFVNISSPHLLHVGSKSQRSADRDSLSPSSLTPSPSSPLRPLEASCPRSAPRAHTDVITSVFTFCWGLAKVHVWKTGQLSHSASMS